MGLDGDDVRLIWDENGMIWVYMGLDGDDIGFIWDSFDHGSVDGKNSIG